MMTDEQKRNGVIRPARRWPNGEVPFVIDDVFSEYCNTKAQCVLPDVEGIIHSL